MKLPQLTKDVRSLQSGIGDARSIAPSGYCGTSWHERYVRDRWGGANFSDACRAHDECYETCGRSKSDCDRQFERDMEQACRDTYDGGGLSQVSRAACIGVANTYALAVERMGGDAYRAAQSDSAC